MWYWIENAQEFIENVSWKSIRIQPCIWICVQQTFVLLIHNEMKLNEIKLMEVQFYYDPNEFFLAVPTIIQIFVYRKS
jgi:hypothetical protein